MFSIYLLTYLRVFGWGFVGNGLPIVRWFQFGSWPQLSNLKWMPISVRIGFDTAMKTAHQDDSNDTPQPICEFQVGFPLLWIKDKPG